VADVCTTHPDERIAVAKAGDDLGKAGRFTQNFVDHPVRLADRAPVAAREFVGESVHIEIGLNRVDDRLPSVWQVCKTNGIDRVAFFFEFLHAFSPGSIRTLIAEFGKRDGDGIRDFRSPIGRAGPLNNGTL
jgi:hypothetical protein